MTIRQRLMIVVLANLFFAVAVGWVAIGFWVDESGLWSGWGFGAYAFVSLCVISFLATYLPPFPSGRL